MPKIRVILEEDSGDQTEQVFILPSDLNSLEAIDEAVELFKNQTLPKVEQELLEQAQERLVDQEKKKSLIANGGEYVTVRTRHGMFSFRRQRLQNAEGKPVLLLPDLLSVTLKERCLSWAIRFPFSDVAHLLNECSGAALLSEDSVWRLVQKEANQHDSERGKAIQAVQTQSEEALPSPSFTMVTASDLYEGMIPEFVTLTDAICVPSQKPTREKAGQEKKVKEAKRHDTDVFVLPRRDGGEQFFCEGVSETWSCVSAVTAFLRREWSGEKLSVIAITDGAKKIRSDLAQLFGDNVRVVLDWYHLAKRVTENLSMVAHGKAEREDWEKQILGLLWRGNVTEAVKFLSSLSARREQAKSDLLGYLDKHETEIIDYERRQKAGKPIGSGRMEKAVDQVIGLRQKNRGMSWTKQGTRSLALLTVAKLNQRCPKCPASA